MTTTGTAPTGYRRAAAGTVGTHFAQPTDSHACRAACYRVSTHSGCEYISILCDAGHSVTMRQVRSRSKGDFGGSEFAASLNDLPAYAPFVAALPVSAVTK